MLMRFSRLPKSVLKTTARLPGSSREKKAMSDLEGKTYAQTHVEELRMGRKPGVGARLKVHYKKFWWLHLIIFVACTLIIVLPLYDSQREKNRYCVYDIHLKLTVSKCICWLPTDCAERHQRLVTRDPIPHPFGSDTELLSP